MFDEGKITQKPIRTTDGLNETFEIVFANEAAYNEWKGNVVALPNNRVRVTSPAYWITGEGAPDFRPSQYIHCAEQDDSYMDPEETFDNLYNDDKPE